MGDNNNPRVEKRLQEETKEAMLKNQLTQLQDKLSTQSRLVKQLIKIEQDPYIGYLDPHFNYALDLIKIILAYHSSVCRICGARGLTPHQYTCRHCMTSSPMDGYYYYPCAPFRIFQYSTEKNDKQYRVQFSCSNDDEFVYQISGIKSSSLDISIDFTVEFTPISSFRNHYFKVDFRRGIFYPRLYKLV